jgi:6-phosphogluconolactonase
MATVSAAGVLVPVPGSPFAVGTDPTAIAFNPSGNLLAVITGDTGVGEVSTFSVSPMGAVSPVPGSPFPAGSGPSSIAFSPDGSFLAITDFGSGPTAGSVSAFSVTATGGLPLAPVSSMATGVPG